MINIFYNFKQILFSALKEIAAKTNVELKEEDFEKFNIEPTKEKSHGDIASNIAMVFAKNFSQNPRQLALQIIELISADKNIKKVEVAGAGFINIFLENSLLYQVIAEIVAGKIDLPNLGKNEKINLEYASPNPTGPIHVGHCRGAIYGDVLASLLKKVGFDVLKEYYINDAGNQINNLIKSAYFRYLKALENADQLAVEMPEGLYPGDYLIPIGESLKQQYQDELKNIPEEKYLSQIRDFVVDEMLQLIIKDLRELGIEHDSYFSEKKELHDNGKIDEAIKILEKKGLIYQGKLPIPQSGKGIVELPADYEEEDQTLFKSTLFGDDLDRVVKKSDGSATYLAADIAYSLNKFQRGAKKLILPLGYDHAGYVKRLESVVKAVSDEQAEIKMILCQMVKFVKNGEPIKMSKRAGNFITAKEVLDEVGKDVMRFIMLTRKNDTPFDFDLAKVIEQSKDNPIFYVQYAHARCCSVLRNLAQQMPQLKDLEKNINEKESAKILENLTDETEIDLMKKIALYQRVVEISAIKFEPHHIAFYLQDLAASFHSLWNKGSENPDLKFIIADKIELTKARIYLVLALKKTISSALDIFNIKAVEELR